MAPKKPPDSDSESVQLIKLIDGQNASEASATTATQSSVRHTGVPLVLLASGLALLVFAFFVVTRPSSSEKAVNHKEISPPLSLAQPRVTMTPPSTLPAGELLLDEPTGLWLFYGGEDPLQRLDLDNGEFVTFGVRADPVVATGSSLVISTTQSGEWSSWVGLDNPGEQPHVWKPGRVAQAANEGDIWIYEDQGPATDDPLWTRFDTDNHVIEERRPALVPLEPMDGLGRASVLVSGPDLVSDGESIFEYVDGNYERRGAGTVLTYDKGHALTLQCPGDTCFVQWVARASWEPFAFPAPYQPPVDTEFLADVSWLYLVTEGIGDTELAAAEPAATEPPAPGSTAGHSAVPEQQHVSAKARIGRGRNHGSGRTIELLPTFVYGSYYFDEETAVNISPNGRWLAWETEVDTVQIVDLVEDKSYDLSNFDRTGDGSLLFVEKSRMNHPATRIVD